MARCSTTTCSVPTAASATPASQQPTGGALLDLRAFSPYGVLENSGLINITPYAGQATTVRLGTTFDYADPDGLRRWRAGDVITGACPGAARCVWAAAGEQ